MSPVDPGYTPVGSDEFWTTGQSAPEVSVSAAPDAAASPPVAGSPASPDASLPPGSTPPPSVPPEAAADDDRQGFVTGDLTPPARPAEPSTPAPEAMLEKRRKDAERAFHQKAQEAAEFKRQLDAERGRVAHYEALLLHAQTQPPASTPTAPAGSAPRIGDLLLTDPDQAAAAIARQAAQAAAAEMQSAFRPVQQQVAATQAHLMDQALETAILQLPQYAALAGTVPRETIRATPLFQQLVSYVQQGVAPADVARAYGAQSYQDLGALVLSNALVTRWNDVGQTLTTSAQHAAETAFAQGRALSAPTGSQPNTALAQPSPALSPEELFVAKSMGLTPAQYLSAKVAI